MTAPAAQEVQTVYFSITVSSPTEQMTSAFGLYQSPILMTHFFFKAVRISLMAMSISFEGTMGSTVDLVLLAVRFVTITLLLLKHERFSLSPLLHRPEPFTNSTNPI